MRIIIGLFVLSLLTSCNSIIEPTFQKIENVQILEATKDLININADMVFDNPNTFALDLAKAEIELIVEDIVISKIDQTYDAEMPANSTFKMPINARMDLKKVYGENPLTAFGKGLQILAAKKLDVNFKGTIKVGKGAAKIEVPIDRVETVKF